MSEYAKNSNRELNENHLFNDFPKPTVQEWREVVEKSLKGATIEEKLVTRTYEGIALQPMYGREDVENIPFLHSNPGEYPYVRGVEQSGYQNQAWEISQEFDFSSPEEFNKVARHDLEKGQTMLHIILDEATDLYHLSIKEEHNHNLNKGLILSSIEDFEKAFYKINLEEVPISIETVNGGKAFFATFVAYLLKQNTDLSKIKGSIGMDPLGQLVQIGTLPNSINNTYDMMSDITKWTIKNLPKVQTIQVNTHQFHNAGGNSVHELAFALATGLEYLRELEKREVSLDDAAGQMQFSFSIGSNFFMEIAKFRAARMLWARIVKELGGNEASQKMRIHARTSAWTKTKYDPYVNILRSTLEAFAGVIGGTESLHISPFDAAIGQSSEFSRRIARNTHLILDKEANISKVADPAGGSWYVESLTYALAEKAWELFQKIEETGGMYESLKFGFPQDLVEKSSENKATNIKKRKDKFVGTNIFPNLKESPLPTKEYQNVSEIKSNDKDIKSNNRVKSLQDFKLTKSIEDCISAATNGATISELIEAMELTSIELPSIRTIPTHRGAEHFESLRKYTNDYISRTGEQIEVFVVNFGPISAYKARADFVTDFFEVGGFHVNHSEGFNLVSDAIKAIKLSKAKIIAICSTDDQYPELVPVLSKKIKLIDSNKTVLLAGNPTSEDKSSYKQFGVDDFIHLRVNNFEMLENLQINGGYRI